MKNIFDIIDLSKKHPNYFNKTILRFAFLFCLIIIIIGLYLNNWSFIYFYSECKENTCFNPLYICDENSFCWKGELCNKYDCSKLLMNKGDKIGEYNFFLENNTFICLIIILIGFIINHIIYRRKYGKNNN